MTLPVTNLDDRSFQDLVDEAKRKIPELCPQWTNHNVSDPGVALIELFAWMTEMTLFRLNQVPDNFYTRMLNLLGFSPFPATAATTEVTFWLTTPLERSVPVPAGTEVTTLGDLGAPRVFTTTSDLVINPPSLSAALTATSPQADAVFVDVWETVRLGAAVQRQNGASPSAGSKVVCFPRIDEERAALGSGADDRPTTVSGDCLYFGFDEPLSSHVIELGIRAETDSYGSRPDKPPLQWEISIDGGWQPAKVPDLRRYGRIGDETGGLNRNGSMTLLLPAGHALVTVDGRPRYWLRARLLPSTNDRPSYRKSPRISGITAVSVGGSVEAEHSETVLFEELGRSSGKPNQRFTCARTPVLEPRRDDEGVDVVVAGRAERWQERDDFVASGPKDLHYSWDSATGEVRFGPLIRHPNPHRSMHGGTVAAAAANGQLAVGDGRATPAAALARRDDTSVFTDPSARTGSTSRQHGAVPPANAIIRIARYRTGGGSIGNGPAGMLTGMRSSIADIAAVDNFIPATGGDDAEQVAEAKLRGPLSVRSGDRAVTQSDYERLVLDAHPRVARVRCLEPAVPGGPVRVLVVPTIEIPPRLRVLNDFALPDEMFNAIEGHLAPRRILGTTIEIGTPRYLGVSVAVRIRATRRHVPGDGDDGGESAALHDRVVAALYEFISPLPAEAMSAKEADRREARKVGIERMDPQRREASGNTTVDRGWPFDTNLYADAIEQLLETVPGVAEVSDVYLFNYDLAVGERSGAGKKMLRIAPNALFLSADHQVVVV